MKSLQAVYQSRTYFAMGPCKETILKMEEWYSSFAVTQVSVSKALQLFIATKENGMALDQTVNHQVSMNKAKRTATSAINETQR